MIDARDACATTSAGCRRCETVPEKCGEDEQFLLLAPLDENAAVAIRKKLGEVGFEYSETGSILVVPVLDRRPTDLVRTLQIEVDDGLQNRVKAVFSTGETAEQWSTTTFIRAEPLNVLFDNLSLEWARRVLQEDLMFSVYQPIIGAADGSIFGYEALIRARHPETDEVVGAGQLIYACQRLNLQHQLDQKARVSAIRSGGNLDLTRHRLFINFLPNTIYDPEICLRTTMEAAEENGVAISQLVFEVTETEQISSLQRLRAILDYYRARGAKVALDDISSGYASLQYLADLMPDYVKIDRDLVTMAANSSSARHTLESIVTLSKKLDILVVAEGIETEAELRICQNAGVDFLQGFLFALPANPPYPVANTHFMARAA